MLQLNKPTQRWYATLNFMANRIYNPVTQRMEVEGSENHVPTIISMAMDFGSVVVESAKLAARGEPVIASDEVINQRTLVCLGCLNWNPRGYGGLGKCEACGCSALKLKVAASRCPLSKWNQ